MTSLFYNVSIGTLNSKETINKIREYILNNYKEELKKRPSLHKYIVNTSEYLQNLVKEIRNSEQIKNSICKQYTNCDISPLENTDELYISHYNIDGGGDQGLYNKHYDGVLRFINNATIVRALIYINSNDDFVVHFLDSKISHHFKTYQYGILDFNREYHFVEGKYDKNIDIKNTRILLKINYLICPKCSKIYASFIIFLNAFVFYIVKSCMEYSKSPQNIFQYIIGFFCNLFRVVNNISIYLTFLLIIIILTFIFLLIYYLIKKIIYFINNTKIKKINLKNRIIN